ncbi:hypothetical protein [Paenibacillus bouchesdurhonensis]|uniref:hypothetical protein n=1 Tax=Paenibacillus bouchesdurhonensis TaxID=1870990 RepID=UPI000DA6090A|nr:hypothetical protein [Paenibacillus bouchesdurhonensis]
MSLWTDSPRMSGPPQTEDVAVILDYVKQLANTAAKMAKDLEFILNGNVAFDNIRAEGIEAKNIKAEAITTDKLQANSVSTSKLQAGAVTAEKITVNELSAISANLGHIIAGLIEAVDIFGSYIATSRYYPRAEMSNTSNMFKASSSANKYAAVDSNGPVGSPEISVNDQGQRLYLYQQSSHSLISSSGRLTINVQDRINLQPGYLGGVYVSFSQLFDLDDGKSLLQKLDSKMDKP